MVKPYPKPETKKKTARKFQPSQRKLLEKEIEKLSRELCSWLWPECAFKDYDGGRCGGVLQWSHIISRRKSPYLTYAIGNTVMGCSHHNGLDHWGDKYISGWYVSRFGGDAWIALERESVSHIGKLPAEWELQEWIERYKFLLDDRPVLYTTDLLVELGYYGKWPK